MTGTEHPKIMRAAEEKLSWKQLLEYKEKFEMACSRFETKAIKLLLEDAVTGYCADKDIVDAVWNQSRLMKVSGSDKENLPGNSKNIH